ncbi:hypothetical protein AOL_s00193g186 [Orbilia oligospora ATCC 24927]|uniref:Uncharacterized protein n=1 Tax=Arthrobotrys oligospora (strain ATCC 24927 / CBS 115.81 / DSM 1491) TaxID=756982 RepID=G1XRI7_ARTOA|nr:hypothetical protein AOL_s00193g186 [Orbilia oligospora ATCC 24927]EGX44274.1 hypothetical protein AOL_s00193g186 [Orbilia oligospora ATCC 24927]
MADPPPLCHSTPLKDANPKTLAGTEDQKHKTTAPAFGGVGTTKNFSFDFGASEARHAVTGTELDAISLTSEPEASTIELGDTAIPVEVEPEKAKATPKDIPSGLVEEFRESLELSKKLNESLQRLAGQLGPVSFDINADKQKLLSEPKAPQPPPPINIISNDIGLYEIPSWQDRTSKWNPSESIDLTGASQFPIDPDTISAPSGTSAGASFHLTRNKSSFFVQSEASTTRPPINLPSNNNVISNKATEQPSQDPKATPLGINDASKLKQTLFPSNVVEEKPPIPDPEQHKKLKEASIRQWANHLPVSKTDEKHVHAFDIDKPIIDIPTDSILKQDTSLKFSPPDPKNRLQRRHSDSFCSSGRVTHKNTSFVGKIKPYDFGRDPKRRPRTPTRRMKYANRSPDKSELRSDDEPEVDDTEHAEEITTPVKSAAQDETASILTGNDTDYTPYKTKLLLSEEEMRKEPYFSKLLPFKDVKRTSEKNRRYKRVFYDEQCRSIWIGAYETVKARKTGSYNPLTEKREFDKRKGEQEIYNPADESRGSVDYKTHQVFECYFGMLEVNDEIKKITDKQEAAGDEIPKLKEQYDSGEYGEFETAEVMAPYIRSRELEVTTILPDQLKKLKVRQTLLKRAGENNLWDIAKMDHKFHYNGEMLDGILFMRNFFAEISSAYTQAELKEMGIDIPHEEF